MKRRNFLKAMGAAAPASFTVNGLAARAMSKSLMLQPFSCEALNDRVLVLIQLHGGNDGLNTLIPLEQYDVYKNLRPVIGILDQGPRKFLELDGSLPVQDQIGLHPDLGAIKGLYEDGYVNFVHEVAYTHINGSHFRGTDIWLSGVDGTIGVEAAESGWMGRYLHHRFPDFPNAYPTDAMPDPPGLEFGTHIVSLGFHRAQGIPMGLTMSNNPAAFYEDVTAVGGLLPEDIPDSYWGDEIRFITEVEKSTQKYSERLAQVYLNGTNAPEVSYPEVYHTPTSRNYTNRLSAQLRTVARLISGGCKTKIYLVRLSGFDTHADQAIAGKPSFGGHGALLYHLSEAVGAFFQDLRAQNLDDRVLGMTFSEFGRQVAENGDWGTDHGTSAPMILFGKAIKPGITGHLPDLSQIENNRFVGFQHDYRQVFTTILQDWLGANNGSLAHVEYEEFANKKLDLIDKAFQDIDGETVNFVADIRCDPTPDIEVPEADEPLATDVQDALAESAITVRLFPNPAVDQVTLEMEAFKLFSAQLLVHDLQGKCVFHKELRLYTGTHLEKISLSGWSGGNYWVKIEGPGGIRKQVQFVKR